MDRRARVFVDFWNFQLEWNDRTSKARCEWPKLPRALIEKGQSTLRVAGIADALLLEETRVYASFDPDGPSDLKLRGWLDAFLDRQPGFRVFLRERRAQARSLRCRTCAHEIRNCPRCSNPLVRKPEKGVDAAIVTDLLSLAWEGAYDVGLLLTSDSDLIPAVERLQEKGIKVINAGWRGRGDDLARVCWASIQIDDIVSQLRR